MPAWWSAYQSVLCHISKVWLLKVLELYPTFLLLRFICRIWKNFNFGVKCHVHVHFNICSTKLKMAICCSGPDIHLPIQVQSGPRSLLTKIFLDIDYLWWPLPAWVTKTIALGPPVTLCEGLLQSMRCLCVWWCLYFDFSCATCPSCWVSFAVIKDLIWPLPLEYLFFLQSLTPFF